MHKITLELLMEASIVVAVAVGHRSAEELLEDGSGPRRDVLVGEELCAYLNCGRG